MVGIFCFEVEVLLALFVCQVIQAAQSQLPSLFVDAQSGVLLGNLKTPLSQATATNLITEWINAVSYILLLNNTILRRTHMQQMYF